MNEQPRNDQPMEDRLPLKPTWKFSIGFLGWYLMVGLIYGALLRNDPQGEAAIILGGLLVFPAQIVALIVLFVVKRLRSVGWGMLSALGVNFFISVIFGNWLEAVCFIPFFSGIK